MRAKYPVLVFIKQWDDWQVVEEAIPSGLKGELYFFLVTVLGYPRK